MLTDLHSHLITAIDDGAQTEEDSIALLHGLFALGYRNCIITPHIYQGLFNNKEQNILLGLEKLKALCESQKIPMKLEAAAEYFFDDHFFLLLENKKLLTFGKNFVLFELPVQNRPMMLEDIIFKLNLAAYSPVLAHAERYVYFHDKKMRDYQAIREKGISFQVNLMSVTGYYGEPFKRAARDLIKNNMVDFLGTDAHRPNQLPVIAESLKDGLVQELIASGRLQNEKLS